MREIWQFLAVLFAGVIVALLAVLWMVKGGDDREKRMYTYQVLLSPDTIQTMSNRAIRLDKGEGSSSYLIDSIHFTFLNSDTKKWEERLVDMDPYSKFFEEIEADRGYLKPSDETMRSYQGSLSKLAFFVKQRSAGEIKNDVDLFQTLEFNSTGNGYRIDLHLDQSNREWVYFNHSGILPFAVEVLKK
jgi:hypothetical protein